MHKSTTATPYVICLHTPIMTKDKFEEESGLRAGQLDAQLRRNNLPVFKLGRLSLINNAKLLHAEASLAIIPVMTFAKFALVSGLRERQVEAQADLEHIPTTYIGRLRVVDIARLTTLCIEQEVDHDALDHHV